MSLLVDHGLIGAGIYITVIILCISKIRRLEADHTETHNLLLILIGLIVSLIFVIVAGQGSNNKVLEIDIWLYGLIPLAYDMLKQRIKLQENKTQGEDIVIVNNSKHYGSWKDDRKQ